MSDEKPYIDQDALALVADVREYAVYLRELGVDRLEVSLSNLEHAGAHTKEAMKQKDATPPVSSALARSAHAATRDQLIKEQRTKSESRDDRAADDLSNAPRTQISYQTSSEQRTSDMAKRKTSTPDETQATADAQDQTALFEMPTQPAPQDSLFGEITPKDALSLPHPDETLEDIHQDIGDCTRCPLYQGRTKIVHSEGEQHARLMFVGEAPGADEDASGRPFVGRAGQLLNKIIEAIGLKREQVFIGNVNRCRPPQNRTPTPAEAKTCKPFLLREIAIVKPDVIVVMGNTAMKNLLDTKEGITKLRGTFQDYGETKVMPTFHPAYLLRDPSKKRETWDDMKKVRDYLNEKRQAK